MSIFSVHRNEGLNVETKLQIFSFIPINTTDAIKQLQTGLNEMNIDDPLVIDGIFGPKTEQVIVDAGFTLPISQDDFSRITSLSPLDDTVSSSAKTSSPSGKHTSVSKISLSKPKMSWNPFGPTFKKDTPTEKALVWGIWLILAALLVWGGIVLFGEKKGKK